MKFVFYSCFFVFLFISCKSTAPIAFREIKQNTIIQEYLDDYTRPIGRVEDGVFYRATIYETDIRETNEDFSYKTITTYRPPKINPNAGEYELLQNIEMYFFEDNHVIYWTHNSAKEDSLKFKKWDDRNAVDHNNVKHIKHGYIRYIDKDFFEVYLEDYKSSNSYNECVYCASESMQRLSKRRSRFKHKFEKRGNSKYAFKQKIIEERIERIWVKRISKCEPKSIVLQMQIMPKNIYFGQNHDAIALRGVRYDKEILSQGNKYIYTRTQDIFNFGKLKDSTTTHKEVSADLWFRKQKIY